MIAAQSVQRNDTCVVESHKRLMAAVLQAVVDDCRGSVYRRGAGYGEPTDLGGVHRALAYVASTDRTWPFSFENLCEALGVDVGCFRQELQSKDAPRRASGGKNP